MEQGNGAILRLIRDGHGVTRSDLAAGIGLGRSAVASRLGPLLASGLVVESDDGVSTGGRPAMVLRFNRAAGVLLAADLGATHCRLEVTDLAGEPLAAAAEDLDIERGPDAVLGHVLDRAAALLEQAGRGPRDVAGIGVGLPGPVEHATGRAISPPIMRGWDGYSVPAAFAASYAAPVLVDNDVNIMALAEQRRCWPDVRHLLYVKVGTGIGCGIVADGEVYRGAQGAAGDLGHLRVNGYDEVVCRCGNTACLEAVAGGAALAAALRERGLEATAAATSGASPAGASRRPSRWSATPAG